MKASLTKINSEEQMLQAVAEARCHDPFAVLGRHVIGNDVLVRVFAPEAVNVVIVDNQAQMKRRPNTDVFEWRGRASSLPRYYRLCFHGSNDHRHVTYDPYCFPPQITDHDLHLLREGKLRYSYQVLGANVRVVEGVEGVLFATWSPNAERVSVVGDFNRWDGRAHPMRSRGDTGVWELFIPGLLAGEKYKFEIRNRPTGEVFLKADPYGTRFELRPSTASIVSDPGTYRWFDQDWLLKRAQADWLHAPMAIYEVHLGSWRKSENAEFLGYRKIAEQLVMHVKDLGYTHIELMPITEHPLDDSWGYQTVGYFAPTSRFGTPDDFRYFINHCHANGIGVILDWVPAHFPRDAHGLARYDGTALFEHEDPRQSEQADWGTLIFNYARNEVRNFLLSSAVYWCNEFHIDGLRVDAVASMLYLDYSKSEGEWIPNKYGGRENLEAISFLRELNSVIHEKFPGVLVFAEESTAWPMVSRPVYVGGLGFSMKWNMGWMNDTLSYFEQDPVYRRYRHDKLTFSQLYAYTENFVLPFSHDEVVHGKRSLHYKMPGDAWQRLANLRLLYAYQYTHPGKKLLFMGSEFAQGEEWSHKRGLDWHVLNYASHRSVQDMIRLLNQLYREEPALHYFDFDARGFEWLDCHDSEQSVLSFLRKSENQFLVVVLNFTPVPREGYRVGIPEAGFYRELFNSDSEFFGGSNAGNVGGVPSDPMEWMGRPHSICITLPPLGALILKRD